MIIEDKSDASSARLADRNGAFFFIIRATHWGSEDIVK